MARPCHLLLEGSKLFAATSLGDHLIWDLGVLQTDYCALLRRIWKEVPVVWEEGVPVKRRPPKGHRCSRR